MDPEPCSCCLAAIHRSLLLARSSRFRRSPLRHSRVRRTYPRGHHRRGPHPTSPFAARSGGHHASRAEQHPTRWRGYQESGSIASPCANAQARPGPRRSSPATARSADTHWEIRTDRGDADRAVSEPGPGLVAGPEAFAEPDENEALHSRADLLRNRSRELASRSTSSGSATGGLTLHETNQPRPLRLVMSPSSRGSASSRGPGVSSAHPPIANQKSGILPQRCPISCTILWDEPKILASNLKILASNLPNAGWARSPAVFQIGRGGAVRDLRLP